MVAGLQHLVAGLRAGLAPPPPVLTPEERVAAFRALVESHRHVTAVADDSRDSIY